MTKFSELQIGERFHYNIDADGHEPYLYKLSETEAYIEHGSHSGMRDEIALDETVSVWDKPVVLHADPTEIERAALTILMGSRGDQPRADHTGLQCYIRALVSDPDERRSLDLYIWEAHVETDDGKISLHELCNEMGYECWHKQWDRDHDAFGSILDHESRGRRSVTREERELALLDDAAAKLTHAIRDYRVAGRPTGDQSHTISGMGAPLLRVTTSLAAAVAEYHNRMLNLYAGEKIHLEGLLTDVTPDDLISQTEAAQIANITPQAINNAIRSGKIRAYAEIDAVPHRPGARRVSRSDVECIW